MTNEEKSATKMFPQPPPGYRPATAEEELEIVKLGMMSSSADSIIRRCEAEIRAARAETQLAQRQMGVVRTLNAKLYKSLGVEGVAGDITTGADEKIYILVDKAARDAALKPAKEPTPKKEEGEK